MAALSRFFHKERSQSEKTLNKARSFHIPQRYGMFIVCVIRFVRPSSKIQRKSFYYSTLFNSHCSRRFTQSSPKGKGKKQNSGSKRERGIYNLIKFPMQCEAEYFLGLMSLWISGVWLMRCASFIHFRETQRVLPFANALSSYKRNAEHLRYLDG